MQPGWKPSLAAPGHRLSIVAALALLLVLLGTACGGSSDPNRVQILEINADITIDPVAGDPVVFLERVGASGDLVTIDVNLKMTFAQEFDAFTLHFSFDPTLIKFAGLMQTPEADGRTFNPFGECGSGATYCGKHPAGVCDLMTNVCSAPPTKVGTVCVQDMDCDLPATTGPPFCPPPGDENITGELFLGLAGSIGLCETFDLPGTVTLLRLGFNVTNVIEDPLGSPLTLVSGSAQSGDCAILRFPTDLGIPCDDGNARITSSR